MKRWVKGILIVALGFVLIGGVGVGICLALGASWSDATIIAGNRGWRNEESQLWDFADQEIHSVELDTGTSEVIWQVGEYFRVETTGSGPNVACSVRNGVLKVEEDGSAGGWFFNWIVDDRGLHSRHRVITLTVPEGVVLRKADISVGMGSLEADVISADEADIQVGVGVFSCENLNVSGTVRLNVDVGGVQINSGRAESLTAEVGVGSAVLDDFVCGPVSMSADTGSIEYSGVIRGDLEAQCDLGGVTLYLDGSEKDYNYTMECDLGSIEIDGYSYSSLSGGQKIENGALYTADLSCDLGSIELVFD